MKSGNIELVYYAIFGADQTKYGYLIMTLIIISMIISAQKGKIFLAYFIEYGCSKVLKRRG